MWQALWFALRLGAGAWLLWRVRPPTHTTGDEGRAACTVVVPARNEERNLPHLLTSLVPQLRDGDEVIVVDDESADRTASVAAASGARVVPAGARPEGWAGKPWACHTGAATASNDVLVFLDADVTLAAGALEDLLATQTRAARDGLLSVQPHHVTVRPYERLSLLFNVVAMMGTDAFTPLGDRIRPAGAFGACLVTSAASYRAVGGHAAVRGEVLEDVALARAYRRAGRPLVCRGGRRVVSFRMYPDGARQLAEGWTKNLAGGARRTRPVTLLLVVLWLSLCIQAPWWLVTGGAAGVLAYVLVVAELAWMVRRVGRFGVWAVVLFPVPLIAFLALFARSVFVTVVRRRVTWRGRSLPV